LSATAATAAAATDDVIAPTCFVYKYLFQQSYIIMDVGILLAHRPKRLQLAVAMPTNRKPSDFKSGCYFLREV